MGDCRPVLGLLDLLQVIFFFFFSKKQTVFKQQPFFKILSCFQVSRNEVYGSLFLRLKRELLTKLEVATDAQIQVNTVCTRKINLLYLSNITRSFMPFFQRLIDLSYAFVGFAELQDIVFAIMKRCADIKRPYLKR